MYMCIYVCMYICMCVYMYVCIYVWVYICMCVCMYVCIYVCMYITKSYKLELVKNKYLESFPTVFLPRTWNSIPLEIKSLGTLASF